MRGLGNEKAPMRCCTGADMLLFAFLVNWRNLIQYEYHSKTDKRKRVFNTKNLETCKKKRIFAEKKCFTYNIYKVWKR